jgi:hypothetical protein
MEPVMRSHAFIAVAASAVAAAAAHGFVFNWNVASGDWHTRSNWDIGDVLGRLPNASDDAQFANGGTASLTMGPVSIRTVSVLNGSALNIGQSVSTPSRPLIIGEGGPGTIVHTGGTVTASVLQFGEWWGNAGGSYTMSGDAQLNLSALAYVGKRSPGTFTQLGGAVTVGSETHVGWGRTSTYTLAGGSLDSGRLTIANADHAGYPNQTSLMEVGAATLGARSLYIDKRTYHHGIFRITDAAAEITVDEYIQIFGGWEAVPGAEVTLGGNLFLRATDAAAVSGLSNTSFTFAGGGTQQEVEAGAADRGADPFARAPGDFHLAGLTVSAGSYLYVVDSVDNQGDGAGNEVLYVNDLVVGPGATLNLLGRTVYAMNVSIDPSATIADSLGGGQLLPFVPAPGAVALVAPAALLASRRRR